MRRAIPLLVAFVLAGCSSGLKHPVHEVTAAYSGNVQRVTIVAHSFWFDPNRLKLKAGSSHDLYDVAILANLHPDWMEHALALAASHGTEMGERLATLIREPRVRGQAKEVQRQDRALQAFARRAAAKRTPGSDSGT